MDDKTLDNEARAAWEALDDDTKTKLRRLGVGPSHERPVITAVPTKVPAVLRFYKKGPFKKGDKFEVTATPGQLFKAQRFAQIVNASFFTLNRVNEGKFEVPMIALTSIDGREMSLPTCMHPEKITLYVEATTDADEFSCEMEGITVRSAGDAKAHDYDSHPLDVTLGTKETL